MSTKRTNQEWLANLKGSGPAYDEALADLRQILLLGLQRGLLLRVNTSAPEFASLAEDFVQESLLKILANLGTFAGRSQFTTWAHKITISTALTELRRKQWQNRSLDGLIDQTEGDYTPSIAADPHPSPDQLAERSEIMNLVHHTIEAKLTDKQRDVLTKSIFQGLPTAEVARQMGMNPNAVYKLLHDARVRLKKELTEIDLSAESILAIFK